MKKEPIINHELMHDSLNIKGLTQSHRNTPCFNDSVKEYKTKCALNNVSLSTEKKLVLRNKQITKKSK